VQAHRGDPRADGRRGNVRAQVAADIDFSQTDQVAETYKPNPTPATAIRSQQTADGQRLARPPPAFRAP
jgi:flagellar M-ring protein FliF